MLFLHFPSGFVANWRKLHEFEHFKPEPGAQEAPGRGLPSSFNHSYVALLDIFNVCLWPFSLWPAMQNCQHGRMGNGRDQDAVFNALHARQKSFLLAILHELSLWWEAGLRGSARKGMGFVIGMNASQGLRQKLRWHLGFRTL